MKKILIFIFSLGLLIGCQSLGKSSLPKAQVFGGYAISSDTIQAESAKKYDSLWKAAEVVGRIRGNIKQSNYTRGFIELETDPGSVWVRLIRLKQGTVRIRVSATKYGLANMDLAQDVFVKIMEEAK